MHPEIDKKLWIFFLEELEKKNLILELDIKYFSTVRKLYILKERDDKKFFSNQYMSKEFSNWMNFFQNSTIRFEDDFHKKNFFINFFINYFLKNPAEKKLLLKNTYYSQIAKENLDKRYDLVFPKIFSNYEDFKEMFLSLSLKDFHIYKEDDFEKLNHFIEQTYSIGNQEKVIFWKKYIDTKKQLNVSNNIVFFTSLKNFIQKNYENDKDILLNGTILKNFIKDIREDNCEIFENLKKQPIYIKLNIEKIFKVFMIDNFSYIQYKNNLLLFAECLLGTFQMKNEKDYLFIDKNNKSGNEKELKIIIEKYPNNFSEKLFKEITMNYLKEIKNKKITWVNNTINDKQNIKLWIAQYLLSKDLNEKPLNSIPNKKI